MENPAAITIGGIGMYNVMLVEDEKKIQEGLKIMIEEVIGSYRVTAEAEHGFAALELLRMQSVDLLITDIRMPQMNGIELLRHVRGLYPSLPVLIISGHEDFTYAKAAMRHNASDYILKPVDRIELSHFLLNLKARLDRERAVEMPNAEAAHEDLTIRRVKELVVSCLDQDVSLPFIAEQVHLNHQYLSTLFKVKTGQNYSDYVTACRMSKAKELLTHTHLKIYEVANLCGYASANHFMAVFRQHCGAKPTEYRKRPLS